MFTLNPSTLSQSATSAYSVSWNYQQNHVLEGLKGLLKQDDLFLTDVTLACDGEFIQAHKLVLSLCSSFFRDLFMKNKTDKSNMIIVLGHVSIQNLKHLLDFMYFGKVDVPVKDMDSFLEAGTMLKVEGIVGNAPPPSPVNQVEPITQTNSSSRRHATICISSETKQQAEPSLAVIVTTSESGDDVPAKKPKISSSILHTEQLPAVSNPSVPVQDFAPAMDVHELFVDSEQDDLDQTKGEEVIDFNLVKTEPIQVYSGFTESHLSEPNQNEEEEVSYDVFNESVFSFETGCETREAGPSTTFRQTNLAGQSSNISSRGKPTGSGGSVRNTGQSLVWRYFEKIDSTNSICSICMKQCKRNDGSTGPLRDHLKRWHKQEFEDMQSQERKAREERNKLIL